MAKFSLTKLAIADLVAIPTGDTDLYLSDQTG